MSSTATIGRESGEAPNLEVSLRAQERSALLKLVINLECDAGGAGADYVRGYYDAIDDVAKAFRERSKAEGR